MGKDRIIFKRYPPQGFKMSWKQQKFEAGECTKYDCTNGALTCGRCKKWWKLDTEEKETSYRSENPRCPDCKHTLIIHCAYCAEHTDLCSECDQDHSVLDCDGNVVPGCPFRNLRDGKPLRPEHEDWFLQQIKSLPRNERLALFPNSRGRQKQVMEKLFEVIALREAGDRKRHDEEFWEMLEAEFYDGRAPRPGRRKHVAPRAKIQAGMAKPGAGKPGRPRGKKSK